MRRVRSRKPSADLHTRGQPTRTTAYARKKIPVVCAPATGQHTSGHARARAPLRERTLLCAFDLLSCFDRGRGTNAVRDSVLVSRTPPTTFPLAVPRATARFTSSLIPPPLLLLRRDAAAIVVGRTRVRGRCRIESRPSALPLYQPGALVKCFSSRIMTRSARL